MSKQVRTLILAGVAVVALVALLLVLVFLLPGSGGGRCFFHRRLGHFRDSARQIHRRRRQNR